MPDPRTVLPVTITDSLSAPDDVIMVGEEAFPGDGRSGPVFLDVHSSVQRMNFGVALLDSDDPMVARDYWNMPVGAKFYMLYVDDNNHVRGETYIYPGGTTVFMAIYVRKGGVDTKIGDGLGENGGYITFEANAETNHLWLLTNSSDIFGFNFQYDLWAGYPFDPDFFPHGGKMGYDFSGATNWTIPAESSLRATKMWSYETHYGSVNTTSMFWAAGFPTSVPGWIPTAVPERRVAQALSPVSVSSLSRWFHVGGGVAAAPEGYGTALLLKETGAEGGGTMRVRCVDFPKAGLGTDSWTVIGRCRTDLATVDPVAYPSSATIGYEVYFEDGTEGSPGYAAWGQLSVIDAGFFGESFDAPDFGAGDLLEFTCYDVLDSSYSGIPDGSLRDVGYGTMGYRTDAEVVAALESIFNPDPWYIYYPVIGGITQPDGTPMYETPWLPQIEIRINGSLVHVSDPSDYHFNEGTHQLLGSAWGFKQTQSNGYRQVTGAQFDPQRYEIPNDKWATFGDFAFQPYAYSPLTSCTDLVASVDHDAATETHTIDAHFSQIIAPYVRSSSIVRYVFDDGAGRVQDSSLSSVTWVFDVSDVEWNSYKKWDVSVTTYNELGLSDTMVVSVYVTRYFSGFGEMPTAARSFEQAFQPRTPSGPTATQESKFR